MRKLDSHLRGAAHPVYGAAAWFQSAVAAPSARFVETALGVFAEHVPWDTARHPDAGRVSLRRI